MGKESFKRLFQMNGAKVVRLQLRCRFIFVCQAEALSSLCKECRFLEGEESAVLQEFSRARNGEIHRTNL